MPRQARSYFLISLAFAMLITILIQGACNEEKESILSREEFIEKIEGEWYVWKYIINAGGYYPYYSVEFYENRIRDNSLIHQTIKTYYEDIDTIYQLGSYALDDPELCTLPKIENMQYWSIYENDDKLKLETTELCGITAKYRIDFSNYVYQSQLGLGTDTVTSIIYADVELVRGDSIALILGNFRLDASNETVTIYFNPFVYRNGIPVYENGFGIYLRRP